MENTHNHHWKRPLLLLMACIGIVMLGSTEVAFAQGVGSACTSNDQCLPMLYCNPMVGLCNQRASAGEECAPGIIECRQNLYCGQNVCKVLGGIGAPCSLDEDCNEGLLCSAGACSDGSAGSACDLDVDCKGGNYCDQFTNLCEGKLAVGDSCNLDHECQDGAACRSGKCRAMQCIPLSQVCEMGGVPCCLPAVCTNGLCLDPPGVSPPPPPPPPQQTGIPLLEPIRGETMIPTDQGGFGPFFYYWNLFYPYVIGLGGAIAVLMGLIGGLEIMTAGGDQGKRSAGMNRFMMSVGGLILLLLSSLILNLLNPTFFRQ